MLKRIKQWRRRRKIERLRREMQELMNWISTANTRLQELDLQRRRLNTEDQAANAEQAQHDESEMLSERCIAPLFSRH